MTAVSESVKIQHLSLTRKDEITHLQEMLHRATQEEHKVLIRKRLLALGETGVEKAPPVAPAPASDLPEGDLALSTA